MGLPKHSGLESITFDCIVKQHGHCTGPAPGSDHGRRCHCEQRQFAKGVLFIIRGRRTVLSLSIAETGPHPQASRCSVTKSNPQNAWEQPYQDRLAQWLTVQLHGPSQASSSFQTCRFPNASFVKGALRAMYLVGGCSPDLSRALFGQCQNLFEYSCVSAYQ